MPPKIIIYGFSASVYFYTIKNMKAYYSNINNFKESTQGMKNLGFEERYASYLERISPERKEHLLSFKNEDDRLRSLAGSILLTDIVKELRDTLSASDHLSITNATSRSDASSISGLSAKNSFDDCTKEYPGLFNITFPISIKCEDIGKPYIAEAPDLKFSISHSGSYAAVVTATSAECKSIGIDIQAKDRKSVLDIADRFYTRVENNIIQSAVSNLEKENLFYEIWSAKEAFIKCDGRGLSYGISNFNADITKNVITDLNGNVIATLKKQACPDGYACYVCYF